MRVDPARSHEIDATGIGRTADADSVSSRAASAATAAGGSDQANQTKTAGLVSLALETADTTSQTVDALRLAVQNGSYPVDPVGISRSILTSNRILD